VASGLVAISAASAWVLIVSPSRKIHQIREQFALIERGDSEEIVRKKMQPARLAASSLSAPYWDDAALDEGAKQAIGLSIEARVDTFFLPVTAVISFDRTGKALGKHIYD
jgi:uncharacterized membrane protein